MSYITQFAYYDDTSNWGSYQYVSLEDIVNNFLLMYSGDHSLVNNEQRYKVLFHTKRGIQELNYDAFKEVKVLELNICDQLRFVLPPDFVNWVRISIYENGVLRPLQENFQTNYSQAYLQDNECNILFDHLGAVLKPEYSNIDYDRLTGSKKGLYLNQDSPFNGEQGYLYEGAWYFDYSVGSRYGLNSETANMNPTFSIDRKTGVINFGSEMGDKTVIIEYVSDGMENGDDSKVSVNKMFEKYLYSYIEYEILSSKLGVQEYVIRRAKRKMISLLRNARIRMSNLHPGRLLMSIRSKGKWLK